MARAAKLKVYCTSIGFYDALVAAPSQKAALKAWGTTTDLFGAGRASVIDDPDLQAEALANPGEVIKRPRGGDPEKLIAAMEEEERAERSRPAPKARRPAPTAANDRMPIPEPPPDRSALAAAEKVLNDAKSELDGKLDEVAADREALERREAKIKADGERRIVELKATRDLARDEYERAVRKRR